MDKQKMVYDFHKAFDIPIEETPTPPDRLTQALRVSLILEELGELQTAMAKGDIVEIADGLADLLYVVYGTAVSCGIDIQPIFAEVHRSNMSKVGGHKRQDGKWIKPETYSPANLYPILESQGAFMEERATGVNTKTYNAAAGVWEATSDLPLGGWQCGRCEQEKKDIPVTIVEHSLRCSKRLPETL